MHALLKASEVLFHQVVEASLSEGRPIRSQTWASWKDVFAFMKSPFRFLCEYHVWTPGVLVTLFGAGLLLQGQVNHGDTSAGLFHFGCSAFQCKVPALEGFTAKCWEPWQSALFKDHASKVGFQASSKEHAPPNPYPIHLNARLGAAFAWSVLDQWFICCTEPNSHQTKVL